MGHFFDCGLFLDSFHSQKIVALHPVVERGNCLVRERLFLKLGTGVEEFLEGCQIILPRLIGVSKILAKITKYMMGCEILGIFV